MKTQYHVILKKVFKNGTETFKFKSLVAATAFAENRLHKLIDILEFENNEFVSLIA